MPLVAAVLCLSPTLAWAQNRDVEEIVNAKDKVARFSISTGFDLSTGHYGDPDKTDIVVVPVSLRYRANDWLSIGAAMPWIRINGPDVVLGPDNRPLPGFPIARQVRSGVGDLSLSTTVSVPTGDTSPWLVDLTGRVKLPTAAKSNGLTTGKLDVSASVEVSYVIGKWVPSLELGMRFPGSPAGINLRNSVAVSAGATRILKKGALIATYDYERSFSPFSADSHSLFGAYVRPVAKRVDVTGYGIAGLSKGAPAIEAGLLVTIKLD